MSESAVCLRDGDSPLSIDDAIISVLAARRVAGLSIRQMSHRLWDIGFEVSSMQLFWRVKRLSDDGVIVQSSYNDGNSPRYLLKESRAHFRSSGDD